VSEGHEEIFSRLSVLDIGCARMDERIIKLSENHEDVKKGLRAIEIQNAKNIKIILFGIGLITALVNGAIKFIQ
jgi:hypothetical protein